MAKNFDRGLSITLLHLLLIIFMERPVLGIKTKQVFSYAVESLCAIRRD